MKATAYIVLKKRGPVRMTKGKPDLARDEIAIGLRIEVPDSAFLAPIVFADLNVPDHAVVVPEVKVDVEEPASVDRSGEAGETHSEAEGLDPEGESAVPAKQGDAPNSLPSPSPPSSPESDL